MKNYYNRQAVNFNIYNLERVEHQFISFHLALIQYQKKTEQIGYRSLLREASRK